MAAEERPQKRGECLRRGKKKREEESRGYAKDKLPPQGAKALAITLSTQASAEHWCATVDLDGDGADLPQHIGGMHPNYGRKGTG